MITRRWLTPVLVLLVLIAGACGTAKPAASSAGSSPDTLVIRNFAFAPGTLTVAPGATVTVINEDQTTHTVTADNQAFNTGDIQGGQTVTFTAPTAAGSYGYRCQIHQYMTGTLVVS